MLGEKIKYYRNQKGYSQDELAMKLHVVRQTISKYETGISVPDANLLIEMAKVLEVRVSDLLELDDNVPLEKELERLNQILALKIEEEQKQQQVQKKRGLLLSLSIFTLLVCILFEPSLFSLFLISTLLLSCLIILYKNLELFSENYNENDLKVWKITSIFNGLIMCVGFLIALGIEVGYIALSKSQQQKLATILISTVVIYIGLVAPRLPYSRYIGLRLPWTVVDEKTWKVAHRCLGIAYIILSSWQIDFDRLTMIFISSWIGIPAILSGIYYYRKMNGK